MQKTSTLFKTTIDTENIDFKIHCANNQLQIFADENQISQVLLNLIKNAIEGLQDTKNKKIILSATTNHQNRTIITIEDNGEGISKELISQIFIPFFSTKKEGSGVGLSLSKHIMKMHNGALTVYSIPNKSTVFTLIF